MSSGNMAERRGLEFMAMLEKCLSDDDIDFPVHGERVGNLGRGIRDHVGIQSEKREEYDLGPVEAQVGEESSARGAPQILLHNSKMAARPSSPNRPGGHVTEMPAPDWLRSARPAKSEFARDSQRRCGRTGFS